MDCHQSKSMSDRLPPVLNLSKDLHFLSQPSFVGSESFKDIRDVSKALVDKLKAVGCSSPSARPLIFLAHSLGGIVLKQAMTQMANGSDSSVHLLSKFLAVMSFAVPNRGMKTSHLLPLVRNQPNENLVQRLSEGCAYLAELDEQFSGLGFVRNVRIVSVFETARSRIPELTPEGWKREGPFEILLERESAIHHLSKEEDCFAIDQDHSNLVKFSEDDSDLLIILDRLNETYSQVLPDSYLTGAMRSQLDPVVSQSVDIRTVQEDAAKNQQMQKRLRNAILESLAKKVTQSRYDTVDDAHSDTFEWVFQPGTVGLIEWLDNDSSIFWVNGKPGSGKSTLMKYICSRRHQYRRSKRTDEEDPENIDAHFFFSHRGSHLQKSLEGLLHAILHQILSRNERLADKVLARFKWFQEEDFPEWTRHRLEDALFCIMQQNEANLQIRLFLDALDEYDGEPKSVANLVLTLVDKARSSKTHLKICLASRPWNIFSEKFGDGPGLRMQDCTMNDISRYVTARLHHNPEAVRLSQIPGSDMQNFPRRIMQRADGVFLWVRLVLDNLLAALTDGASIGEINDMLEDVPADLEDFYGFILARIPKAFRRKSYIMLETVARARFPLTWQRLLHVEGCVSAGYSNANGSKYSLSELDIDTASRRIKSHTGGLIELKYSDDKTESIVQLMHQTVKEFLLKPNSLSTLLQPNDPIFPWNGHSFLAQGLLSLYLGRCFTMSESIDIYKDCVYHLVESERSTGLSQKAMLDSIENARWSEDLISPAISSTYYHSKTHLESKTRRFSLVYVSTLKPQLLFAVTCDLRIYVRDTIGYKASGLCANELGRLLHHCLDSIWPTYVILGIDLTTMIQMILTFGASTSAMLDGANPLQAYMQHYHYLGPNNEFLPQDYRLRNGLEIEPYHKEDYEHKMGSSSRVLELLCKSGADPNIDISFSGLVAEKYSCKSLHLVHDVTGVSILLSYGADINALDSRRRTPLDYFFDRWQDFDLSDSETYVANMFQRGARVSSVNLDTPVRRKYLAPLLAKHPLEMIKLPSTHKGFWKRFLKKRKH